MKLTEVRVQNFRNFLDSTPVAIGQDVTCLVGKNESGKTAFLQALYRANPARPRVSLSILDHYPAWLEKRHRAQGKNLEEFKPIQTTFQLERRDIDAFESRFGKDSFASKELKIERAYNGTKYFNYEVSEGKIVAHLLAHAAFSEGLLERGAALKSLSDLEDFIKGLEVTSKEDGAALTKVKETIAEIQGKSKSLKQAVLDFLDELTPKFFYFDEYSSLPGIVKIRELLAKEQKDLKEDEATARSLLEMAGSEDEYLLHSEFEIRHRELENVANAITAEVLEYWTTNRNLQVQLAISQKTVAAANGHQAVLDELRVRLYDTRHMLSLPFDERSTGFRWFFSFLAAFSEFERSNRPVIILLDEPGLGLHARAQSDFLRFINERLAKKCQVIYSTHSPFMVQPDHLDRVRLVEDKGREVGSRVTSDVLAIDRDTLFPLQGALGYDLAQHLFIAPHNLVVEGTSDFVYLQSISEFLGGLGRECLDPRWSLVPVGGADLVPTFVALLGGRLQITVVVDSRKEGHQKLLRLADQKILERNRIISIGEVLGRKLADIEDLFEPHEYLFLYNKAFKSNISLDDLKGDDPIVMRIARHIGVDRFDHGKPADVFLREKDPFLKSLSDKTLARFEALFKRANNTLTPKRPALSELEPVS